MTFLKSLEIITITIKLDVSNFFPFDRVNYNYSISPDKTKMLYAHNSCLRFQICMDLTNYQKPSVITLIQNEI